MALTPFKTPQSPLNRSRSSSCSSPVRNRIVYQEVYSIGANTLVRSYSCDQVFNKDENGRTFQTTQIQVSSFLTPEKKINLKPEEGKPKEPRRLVYESPPIMTDDEKKNGEPKKNPSVMRTILKKTVMLTFLTVASACALYFYLYRECGYVWELDKTELELKEHVFGQNQAVTKIQSVLKMANSTSDIHTMIFTGGVGVGKTYSSSIISRNFPWSSNKLLTYSERFAEDVETLINQKLSTCGCNLIIVDDLTVKSVNEAINLIVLLNNRRKKKENLLVILIFQTQSLEDRNDILSGFKDTFLNVNFISFQPLTQDVVEECFKWEIKRQGVIIPSEELRKLIEDKMKPVDVAKGLIGCKGVDVEVASYYRKPGIEPD